MKKSTCFLLFITLFSCEKKAIDTPETLQKVKKIYRKYSDFSDYKPTTYSEYVHDNSGKLLKEKIRGYFGDVDYKYNYTNDRLENISIEDTLSGKTTGILFKVKYDTQSRIIEWSNEDDSLLETFEYLSDSQIPIKRTVTAHNILRQYSEYTVQNGNIVEERMFDDSKELANIVSFKYDTNNNYYDDISKVYYMPRLDGVAIYFSKNNIIERNVVFKKETLKRKSIVKTQLILNEKGLVYRVSDEDLIQNYGLYFEIVYANILNP
jgi:hypothetical protein